MASGTASAHSFLTIHSSQANKHPTKDRVGLAVRLVNAEYDDSTSKICRASRPDRVTLLLGREENVTNFGGFEKRPSREFGEKEMKEWFFSIQRENEFYFQSSEVKEYGQ